MDDSKRDAAAEEEFFDGHCCTTGDCPHEKHRDCLISAFGAGWSACAKEMAARYGTHSEQYWKNQLTQANETIAAQENELRKLRDENAWQCAENSNQIEVIAQLRAELEALHSMHSKSFSQYWCSGFGPMEARAVWKQKNDEQKHMVTWFHAWSNSLKERDRWKEQAEKLARVLKVYADSTIFQMPGTAKEALAAFEAFKKERVE